MNITTPTSERDMILDALAVWVRQRPGLEFGNYGDVSAYRSELRGITKDLHQAEFLLRYVRPRESITADMLKAAFRSGFSGRLSWAPATQKQHPSKGRASLIPAKAAHLDYCTGQYWPTEYRRAVCAVLASAIWSWWRDACMPEPDTNKPTRAELAGEEFCSQPVRYDGLSAGDYLRRNAVREFGRSVAKRWFD